MFRSVGHNKEKNSWSLKHIHSILDRMKKKSEGENYSELISIH